MLKATTVSFALALGFTAGCQDPNLDETSSSLQLSGAIFTTLADGSRVNANIYADKDDVYLDGGPGNGSPSQAAALPAGDYYFQVTDPSGKILLSLDSIDNRRLTIDDDGLIAAVFDHVTGNDVDHGALTVQLMPYADTPNPGGEYKVWLTPVADYGDPSSHFHGFYPSRSKTDNYKVRVREEEPSPFCGDGNMDSGEACDDGNTADGDGCSANCTIETPPPPPPCCGDGHLDSGEACDDGNTASGDGCSPTCEIETPPPPPEACCGDGHVDSGEQCDDGNTASGDGCSATCETEEYVPPPPCDPIAGDHPDVTLLN